MQPDDAGMTMAPLRKTRRTLLLSVALILLPPAASAADYFFCAFHVPDLPAGEKPNSYFDRTLQIDLQAGTASFAAGEALNFVHTGNSVGSSYLNFSGERRGYQRQVFDTYRFDLGSHQLIHSYVYFISRRDQQQHFERFVGPTYQQAEARDLVPQAPADGQVWLAWDKSYWHCRPLPCWLYLLRSMERGLAALLSI